MSAKDSKFAGIDRKASALAEFTIRQYRTKLSTWVVLGVGLMATLMVLLFHIDAQTSTIDAIDNDFDSYDFDGDGYPNGQELKYQTNPRDALDHPGLLPGNVQPDDPSKYVNEDDFDWQVDSSVVQHVGLDDDGDCLQPEAGGMVTDSQKDSNDDGQVCKIRLVWSDIENRYVISKDNGVDEDPDENEYYHEAIHRSFVIGFGKVGFVLLIGIFLPLFLASGLIRQEIENDTMHYLVGKPIHRVEILIYRLLGFLAIGLPYIAIIVLVTAIVVGLTAPGDSFFRMKDFGIWLGVILAAWLMLLVYGALFMVFGMIHRLGMIAGIVLGVWEFVIAMITLADPSLMIARLSVVFWGMTIVDACAMMVYPDTPVLLAQGRSMSNRTEWSLETGLLSTPGRLPGTGALNSFWNEVTLAGLSPFMTLILASFVLLLLAAIVIFVGQAIFKGKEIS